MQVIQFKNRRLQKAELALNNGKRSAAIKLGLPLINSRNSEMAFRANRLCGLAHYHLRQYKESIVFLEKSCLLGNYRHDWYNLAMACVFDGKPEKAEEAFKNIYRTNVQPGYLYAVPVPGLLFQYVMALKKCDFFDIARVRANELKSMYAGVGPDTEKQVARGLPAFPLFHKEVESLFHPEEINRWKKELKL